jgi:hypothetical protein
MTTTENFQVEPDFYNSPEECLKGEKNKINTNPRYKFFRQTHFTAGDLDQFLRYKDSTNGNICLPKIDFKENRFGNVDFKSYFWEKYKNINSESIMNTFNYLFYKFKKGIFIKIKNGEMKVFLPFSNKNFINEWHTRIKNNPEYGNLSQLIKSIQERQGYKFNEKYLNKFMDTWYSNNCLVRYEYPIGEGDTNNPNASDMFKTLCRERKIPDIEFFVNRRDFPLIKRNETEAYNHMFDSENFPLVSHNYSSYAPILSMVTAEDFADIPIPTGDDWSRISRKEGKYFAKTCSRSFNMPETPWEERIPTAIFRGASTGCGVDIKTNVRIKLAYISSITPVDKDGIKLIDAGITEWNIRPRKLEGIPYLQTIEYHKFPFKKVERMTPEEQSKYKYIINVDGHVSAYRLSLELESGSCILLADSKYKMWYRNLLKPYEHYIPVKRDLSDLIDQIKWCKNNDKKCRKIAKNAKNFAEYYLCKDGILDYLQKLLFQLKEYNGQYLYNQMNVYDVQCQKQKEIINRNSVVSKGDNSIILNLKNIHKNYQELLLFNYKNNTINIALSKIINEMNKKGMLYENKKLHDNVSTEINEINIWKDFDIIKKKNKNNECNFLHEFFIYKKCIHEILKEDVPNFPFCYSYDEKEKYLLLEKVKGESLSDYINSNRFNFQEFLFIVIQICLVLQLLQNRYGFIHYDTTPWNIILERTQPKVITYLLDSDNIYSVKTGIIPKLIDFEKSHIIYKNNHYGNIFPFSFSSVQDILTLLSTTIHLIVNYPLDRYTVQEVIKLSNFISGTGYRRKPFISSGEGGLGDLKFFFNKTKKFENLINSEKYELENLKPIDLINYITKNFGYNFPLIKIKNVKTDLIINPSQTLGYLLSNDTREKIETFKKSLKDMKKCFSYVGKDTFYYSYVKEVYEMNHNYLLSHFAKFCRQNDLDEDKKYNYFEKENKIIFEGEIEINQNKILKLSHNIFYNSEKVLEKLKEIDEKSRLNNIERKIFIEKIINNEKYNSANSNVLKNLLLKYNTNVLVNDANIYSFIIYSRIIFLKDYDYVKKFDCKFSEEMIKIYEEILKY